MHPAGLVPWVPRSWVLQRPYHRFGPDSSHSITSRILTCEMAESFGLMLLPDPWTEGVGLEPFERHCADDADGDRWYLVSTIKPLLD